MKLYTQEQVLKMLEVCRDSDLYEHILTFEDILKTETPIELPSEEEIKNQLIELVQSLKNYTHESKTILGHDERDASEFVEIFLNQHPHENNN